MHISLADGLSQSSVYDIIQDEKGFTWIATQDGLNRFDGNNFQVFRDEPFDTNSISSNNISSLLCDSKGRIWAGTANHGLNLYYPSREGFRHFMADGTKGALASNLITAIHEDAEGGIWIGTGNGLHRLRERTINNQPFFEFEKIPLKTIAEDTITDKFINVISSGINHDLWVGTFAGLFKINFATSAPVQERWYSKKNNSLSDVYVSSLTIDKKGKVWAGSRNGIDVIDVLTGDRFEISKSSNLQQAMVTNYVSTLYTASNGDIWIGYSDRGVQVVRSLSVNNFPSSILKFDRIESTSSLNNLENGKAISFYEDKITKGLIWTGFNAGGLVRLVPVTKKFATNRLTASPLPSAFVTSVIKDNSQQVWIGTPTGLLKYDRSEKKYVAILPTKYSKIRGSEDYINGLTPGPDGSIYFGTQSELFNIQKSGKDFKIVSYPLPDEVEGNSMRTIVKDEAGRIYVILRYSIYEFIPDEKRFTALIKIEDQKKLLDRGFYLSAFYSDTDGNYWLGTSSGLEYYPKPVSAGGIRKPVSFYHHPSDTNSLRNQNILSISQDRNRNIWLGTMNGLTRVVTEKSKKRFLNYSSRNGLKNNVIYAIIPDSRTGHLWLSTNNGLTEFDPEGTAIATYDVHDGLQSNEFNSYASFRSADGEMFFGGIEGYTSFYPEQIRRDNSTPFVSITSLVLDGNKTISLSDKQQSNTIDLKYKDNTFTVNFIGLHYADPQKNQYAYQLEGFQKDWTYTGSSNRVNFSQVPPGQYIFRVKAANSDGVYNTAGDMFIININPPLYKTIWFYLIIAVCITGILWGLHKYRLSMKLAQVREVEKIRRATAADFHDELGHKLTIISWFAEILKKKISPEQADLRPHLDRIIDASGTLYHTMKDMLWAMDPDKDSVYDLYSQIREFGLELFDNTGVLFDAEEISNELKGKIISPAHKRHVLLIFKEVMNNSLKHAHSTHTHLDLVKDENRIKFRFRDNGTGFKMNGHNVGHGLNNVKRRAHMILGEMSIHSEGDGTVAELDLPLNNLN